MKQVFSSIRLLHLMAIYLLLNSFQLQLHAQAFNWVKNPGSNSVDRGDAITIDNNENSYIVARIGTAGGNHLICGSLNFVLMKRNSSGVCQWEVPIEGEGKSLCYYNNFIYVCGYAGAPANNATLFVAKYNLSGVKIGDSYIATGTGTYPTSIQPYSITVNSNGVFV